MTTLNDAPEIISRENDLFFNYFHNGHRHIICLPKTYLLEQLKSGPTPRDRELAFRQHWLAVQPVVEAKLASGEAGLIYLNAEDFGF